MKGCGLFRPSGLHCTCSLGVCISWFGQSIIMVPTRPSQASLVLRPPPPHPAGVFCALSSSAPWLWCVRWLSHLHVPIPHSGLGVTLESHNSFSALHITYLGACACLPNLEEARRWAVFFSISSKTRRLDQVFYRVQPFCPIYLLPPKQPHALHCAHQHTGVKPAWKYSLNQRCLWTQENTHLCHAGA